MEQGIASSDIQKLNDAGYHTVESIAHATVRKLSEVKGISENKVRVGVVVRGGLCSFR
jgi:DNA repair protein RAD51